MSSYRDYTEATEAVRLSRLIGLFDDIANEIVFVAGAEDAHEAVLDMVDEARQLVRSLQAAPQELTLEVD